MAKVKFPLEMANGVQVRTIEELKENFDLNKVVGYFLDGKLQTWLTDRYYDEEAEQIAELRSDDSELAKKISKIFEIEYVEAEEVDVDKIASDNERIAKIKQFTDDEAIIKNYDKVAFTQEELADLYDAGIQTIYLCEGEFKIPKAKLELNYIVFGGAKTNLPEKKQEEPKIELPIECVEIITKLEEIIKTTREPQIYSDSVSTTVEDDEDWEYNFKSEDEAKTALTTIIKKVFDDVNSTTEAVYGAMIENYVNSSLTFNLDKLKKLYNCAYEMLKEKYNHEFDDEMKKADIKNALQKLQERMNENGRFDEVTERISKFKYSSSDAFSNLDFYVSLCNIEKFDCEFDDGEPDEYRYNSYNGICDIEKDANDYISLMENKITKTFDMEFDDVIYTEFVEIVRTVSDIRCEKDVSKENLSSWYAGLLGRNISGAALGAMAVIGKKIEQQPVADIDIGKKRETQPLTNIQFGIKRESGKPLSDVIFGKVYDTKDNTKGDYGLVLIEPGEKHLEVIKLIRENLDLGLSECKLIVDNTPQIIISDITLEAAKDIEGKLKMVGANVSILNKNSDNIDEEKELLKIFHDLSKKIANGEKNSSQTVNMIWSYLHGDFRRIIKNEKTEDVYTYIDNSCDEGEITREFAEILKDYWRK